MKFGIIRVWENENYCQSLSQEELHTLPTNPAGERTNAEMESAYGGPGLSKAVSLVLDERVRSYSLLCDSKLIWLHAKLIALSSALRVRPTRSVSVAIRPIILFSEPHGWCEVYCRGKYVLPRPYESPIAAENYFCLSS